MKKSFKTKTLTGCISEDRYHADNAIYSKCNRFSSQTVSDSHNCYYIFLSIRPADPTESWQGVLGVVGPAAAARSVCALIQ